MAKESPETGVTVYQPQNAALAPLEAFEQKARAFMETLDGEPLTLGLFDIVKTPTGGGKFWPTPDGMNPVAEIEGVVVHRQRGRAYWAEKFGQGNKAPDCVSPDRHTGYGNRGLAEDEGAGPHDCDSCPWSQWGTARNEKGEQTNGQACRVTHRLFVLPVGGESILPTIVALAPTSDQAAKDYFNRRGARGVTPWTETTRIGLEQVTKGGYTVSVAKFSVGERLSEQDAIAVEEYRAQVLPMLEALAGRVIDAEVRDDDR